MCGILGVRKSFLDDAASIQAAVDAMAWRGPDGVERIEAGDWHLAVARLVISDPGHGQPLWSADGRRVIVFNGAVTSAAAERELVATATANDAELPLHRLARRGGPGLLDTSGHYALAILEPETDRLWLARDPEGEKPLFIVRQGDDVVAFASTVSSLRRLGIDVRLDDRERARFLRFGFDLGPTVASPSQATSRSPVGSPIPVAQPIPMASPSPVASSGNAVQDLDTAFDLDCDLRGAARYGGGEPAARWAPVPATATGSLRERLIRATRRCADAEVPVGLCLSGGIDSACLAAALDRSVPGYQFRAVGTDPEERTHAELVAGRTGIELRPVDGGPEVLHRLPELTRLVGLPLGDPSVLAVHALARRAAADGIRVLLSGEGADELFLGYRRHRAARRLPGWSLPFLGRGGLGMSTWSRLRRAVASTQPYDSLLEVAPPAFRAAVFRDVVLHDPASREVGFSGANGEPFPAGEPESQLHRARRIDREYYLRRDLLPKLDTALMAAGVEGRCPFLDPEVASCPEASADPRTVLGKRPLRDAFRKDLPREVLEGKKRGFGLPLDRWLREEDFLPDLLRESRTRQRDHVREDGLARMLDLHRAGREDLGHPLYLVAAYEYYLRELEES